MNPKDKALGYVYAMIKCTKNGECEGCIEDAKAIVEVVRNDERKRIEKIIDSNEAGFANHYWYKSIKRQIIEKG
jgi:hypothetical protein